MTENSTLTTAEGDAAPDDILEAPPPPHDHKPNWVVFIASAVIILSAVIAAIVIPKSFGEFIGGVNSVVVDSIGWYYVLIVTGFVVFSLAVAFSRLGTLRLGPQEEKPTYGVLSWFGMLFAAGMGIGLVFWGAAEPLWHLAAPPPGVAEATIEAQGQRAMTQTFLHWGVHAWAIYVVVGLAVAYAVHRKGRPVSIRWALEPILGKYTNTWIGDVIDIAAIVGTLFGVATSLGFGVNQIAAGLEHLGLLTSSTTVKIIMIAIITTLATISVVTGLDKGIKILSNLNLGLAALFLVFVLIAGPTLFLLRDFVASMGGYIQDFVRLSFQTFPFYGDAGESWLGGWTTYYWGWWISWSPFVGVFIARISRGRTVREFIIGVLLVPTLVTALWFSIIGGTALYQQIFQDKGLIVDGSVDANTALFDMLNNLPMGQVMAGIAILLVTIFFITSSDSGSFVVDMLSHGGDPNPPTWSRVFWALVEGSVAAALISVAVNGDTSGMGALQALTILAAAPFSVIMIGMCIASWKAMHDDLRRWDDAEEAIVRRELLAQVTDHVVDNTVVAPAPSGSKNPFALMKRPRIPGTKPRRGKPTK